MSTIAADQLGLATWRQLRDAGLSSAALMRRVRDGRLQRVHPGVYAVGHRALRAEGHWLAAVLAGGPGAVLSHVTAAIAWGLHDAHATRIDVTIRRGAARRSRSICAHRCKLDDVDVTTLLGVPITSVARTLLDFAERSPQREVDAAVNQAVRRRLFRAQAMGDVLERAHGRHGLKRLRRSILALHPDTFRSRSELEVLALALFAEHGLPHPEVNGETCGYHVDLLWRDARVAVELDSYEYHRTRFELDADHARDLALGDAGYHVRRLSHRQLTQHGAQTARSIAALLTRGA